jgi:hypothetical protein
MEAGDLERLAAEPVQILRGEQEIAVVVEETAR